MENIIESNDTKPKFYVFLDIDACLWDMDFAWIRLGPFIEGAPFPPLKTSSVTALNILLSSLNKIYDSQLVITSHRRNDLKACYDYLTKYGFIYYKPIFATEYIEGPRDKKIFNFLQGSEGVTIRYSKLPFSTKAFYPDSSKEFSNYVVLDCTQTHSINNIPLKRLILSNHNKKSLTTEQILNFLKRTKIPVSTVLDYPQKQ